MAKLQIKNLSKSFGNTKVLDDININVNEAEFMVLVGPSGSGKSTILRIIAGLDHPDSGQVEIGNKVINHLSCKDRDIAMVFQNYALYPHMNVFDNLAFPLKMKNLNQVVIKKAVNETSELLGINKYLMKKPKELSGGERQRVALGRAIIRKPQLFLMDEPLSNLDAKLRTQMRAELLKLHKTLASTVIYVTHDQIEALTMGSKIAVLNNGKIQQIGIPHDIYHNPSNIFVAGFIGSPPMNFFEFQILSNSKIIFLNKEFELSKTDVVNKFIQKNLTNKPLVLGIRPEDLSLKNDGDLSFNANVDLIEMLGNEYLIYASCSKSSFSVRLFESCSLKRNDSIVISINLNKAHFFDHQTGARILI